jgi:hypothetical protein
MVCGAREEVKKFVVVGEKMNTGRSKKGRVVEEVFMLK